MSKHLLVTLLLTCGMPLAGSMTALAEPQPQAQQQGVESITGTVYDENNEPVIGATVSANGAKGQGVTTDAFGHFTLRVKVGAPLTIGYVGYKSVQMPAARDMQVYLQPTTEVLDQLVVVGYGEQKRANLTGAVATVDVARTMESRPVQDVAKALQGAVPGLTITTTNGGISESANIKIRGVGTLSNSQDSAPLIVVDGVPTDNLDFINPDDIAEISVLKDASSSAIYGARAAFGVILITTKTASTQDRVSVKYDNNFSWNRATVLPTFNKATADIRQRILSARRGNGSMQTEVGKQNFEELYKWAEKWEKAHGDNFYSDFVQLQEYVDEDNIGDFFVNPDGTWYTYAQWNNNAIFNNAAPSQKHNVSLEGTSGKTQYRASFGFDSKQGLLKAAPDKMNRYMASMSVSTEIFKFLKAGARFNFSQREYMDPNTIRNTYQYFWRWNTEEQVFGWAEHDGKTLYFHNPMSDRMLAHTDKQIGNQTRMQAWMLANILPELTLQADFTYDLRTMNENDAYVPQTTWNTWTSAAFNEFTSPTQESSFVRRDNRRYTRWTANAFATYAKTFAADHNLKIMAGFSADRYTYDYYRILRRGVIDYDLANLNLTNGTNFTTAANANRHATAGFFGRINYDYKGIYLIEANGRYDGSSSFPQNKQWAFFPSVSAGYRFSEEGYFKPLKSWWSNGKVRASYGHIGNENVGANAFISTISPTSSNYWLNSQGLLISQFNTPTLVSSDLTWERVITTDVGVDLGFFNNSLTFGFDWYQRDTQDMLARGQELPSVLGDTAPLTNAGTLRTRGWELSIGWNHSFGDAQVYANFNIGDAVTKITKWSDNDNLYQAIPGPGTYGLSRYHEGQTLGEIYGFEFDRFFEESDFTGKDGNQWIYAPGVADQTPLQVTNANFIYGPGDVKFKDLDGDGKITAGDGTIKSHGDVKVIGNMLPRYEYSFRVGGSWKGFDLDLYFQGVGRRKMWYVSSFVIPMAQSNGTATFEHQQDYNWIEYDNAGNAVGYHVDQNNWYPNPYGGGYSNAAVSNNMLGQGAFNFLPSDRYLLNMAYLRMKNITFGYTLPIDITKKAYIQRARIYFSTENPFFIYNGAGRYKIDAEMNGSDAASATSNGMGVAAYGRHNPMMTSYSFGIQVTF